MKWKLAEHRIFEAYLRFYKLKLPNVENYLFMIVIGWTTIYDVF